MEKKKPILGDAANVIGRNAAGLLGKAKKAVVEAVDQNADGKLGLDDLSIVKDTVKTAVKERGEEWSAKQEQLKREKEFKELNPFFEADLEEPGFSLPKLILIAEKDDRHAQSRICDESVGFFFKDKEANVMTIYPEKVDLFRLKLHPDSDCGLYYVDPGDRDLYISLDEYFSYMKIARIGELQKIAQDLGAKHFRVTYKEQKKSFSKTDARANISGKVAKQGAKAEAEHHGSGETYAKVEIAAEMRFHGHEPVEPELHSFRNDPQIKNLIELRMSNNMLTHQTYTLNLGNSSGIKKRDALKIDAAIKALKVEGNASVSSEAQNEERRIFEYEIDF